MKSPLSPRTAICRPSPASRVIWTPGIRWILSARLVSGKSAMSLAKMLSVRPLAARRALTASSMLARKPVTTISSLACVAPSRAFSAAGDSARSTTISGVSAATANPLPASSRRSASPRSKLPRTAAVRMPASASVGAIIWTCAWWPNWRIASAAACAGMSKATDCAAAGTVQRHATPRLAASARADTFVMMIFPRSGTKIVPGCLPEGGSGSRYSAIAAEKKQRAISDEGGRDRGLDRR